MEEKKICEADCIKEFSEEFSKSIADIAQGLQLIKQETVSNFLHQKPNNPTYNFINFNYTKTLENILKACTTDNNIRTERLHAQITLVGSVGKCYQIHGTSGKSDMILGVNDISQIQNAKLFADEGEEFLVDFIKSLSNKDNEMGKEALCFNLIAKSEIIYVYGMSMGSTDKIWWEALYKRVGTHGAHLIIAEHTEIDYEKLENRIKRRTKLKDVKNRFLMHSGVEINPDDPIQNRIHTVLNANIFAPLKGLSGKIGDRELARKKASQKN